MMCRISPFLNESSLGSVAAAVYENNASAFHCATFSWADFGLFLDSSPTCWETTSSGPAAPLSGRTLPAWLSKSATLRTRPDAVAVFGSDVILVIVPRPPDFCGGVYNPQWPPVSLGFCGSGHCGGTEARDARVSLLVDPTPPPWTGDRANASVLLEIFSTLF